MKTMKWILPLLILTVMLCGCPYSSQVPLEATGKKINKELLGTWEPKSSSDDQYKISKDDEFTYKIVKTSKNSKDPQIFKAYITEIDGDAFLNLWEENGSDKAYYFYKLELNSSSSKATLSSVTENITEKFTTGEEMKAFFKKYKNLSFFYEKSQDVFIKD